MPSAEEPTDCSEEPRRPDRVFDNNNKLFCAVLGWGEPKSSLTFITGTDTDMGTDTGKGTAKATAASPSWWTAMGVGRGLPFGDPKHASLERASQAGESFRGDRALRGGRGASVTALNESNEFIWRMEQKLESQEYRDRPWDRPLDRPWSSCVQSSRVDRSTRSITGKEPGGTKVT